MKNAMEEFSKLLIDFKSISKHKYKRSILEISGYPHYENVCSNILSFFFDPNNEHGLKGLVLQSFLECINSEYDFEFENIQIHREFQTIGKNRLDILIKTNDFVIGIENKIFHHLHNDLNDYKKTVELTATNYEKVYNIVLSLNKISTIEELIFLEKNNFINITYDELFKKIKSKIGNFIDNSDFGYLFYLKDFIKSIENLNPKTMEQKTLWSFFKTNSESIQELVNSFNDYKKYLSNKIYTLNSFVPKEEYAPNCQKSWIYEKFVLVFDYEFEEKYFVSVDTSITIEGWKIQIFGRNIESQNYLLNVLCNKSDFLPKSINEYIIDERINYEIFDTEANIEIVANSLIDLLRRLEISKNYS